MVLSNLKAQRMPSEQAKAIGSPELKRLEVIATGPPGEARPTPLVFIHGGWHGAWCWGSFQSYFAEQGYASYALSLRGHGRSEGRERLRWTRASDYLDDMAQVVASLPRTPVLVGHSAGGYLVQKYLESRSAAGAVLLASVSSRGALKLFLRMYRRHPLQGAKVNLTLEPFHFIGQPGLAREAFFSPDIVPEKLQEYFAQLGSESYAFGWDMILDAPRPGRARRIPMLVLGAEEDAVISADEVRATALAYGTEAELFPGMAHDMMLEKDWRKIAERIAQWLRARGW